MPNCTAWVPLEVKEISSVRAPSTSATVSRAASSSIRACRPDR